MKPLILFAVLLALPLSLPAQHKKTIPPPQSVCIWEIDTLYKIVEGLEFGKYIHDTTIYSIDTIPHWIVVPDFARIADSVAFCKLPPSIYRHLPRVDTVYIRDTVYAKSPDSCGIEWLYECHPEAQEGTDIYSYEYYWYREDTPVPEECYRTPVSRVVCCGEICRHPQVSP